jgi:hypothetical protein
MWRVTSHLDRGACVSALSFSLRLHRSVNGPKAAAPQQPSPLGASSRSSLDHDAGVRQWKDCMFSLLDHRQTLHKVAEVMTSALSTSLSSSGSVGENVCDAEAVHVANVARRGKSAAEIVSAVRKAAAADPDRLLRSPAFVSSSIHALLSSLRFAGAARIVGDLPFFFAGRALRNGIMNDELWSDVMLSVALLNVTDKLFDLWQEQLYRHYDVPFEGTVVEGISTSGAQSDEGENADLTVGDDFEVIGISDSDAATSFVVGEHQKPLIPFKAAHAMLSWAANAKDMERAMKVYHIAKVHGVQDLIQDGQLNAVALCQLAVKVVASARKTQFDGGIRKKMVAEIQAVAPAQVLLQDVSWGALNDLLVGLSFSSALTLVKLASERRGGDANVPFYVWAALLRIAAKSRNIAEAEQLFLFLRKRFTLSADDKGELLDVMMRMHASHPPPDFVSALSLFMDHVVSTPDGEPSLAITAEHYKLLIRAADSRNAAALMFLEGCARGLPHDAEAFSSLFSRNPGSSISALSRKLPRDYSSSALDSQIKIPADSDAHVRREEALRFRGKPNVDSTSEVR